MSHEMPGAVEQAGVSDPGDWTRLDDEALLAWRLRDLKLSLNGSGLQARIERLHAELAAAGLVFRPPCYLATEWLCPDRIPAVGVPFYLVHPRLIKLERAMMLEAEGESEADCMKLLRHETGHAINYAYRLFRRSRWRALFGPISARYDPHHYRRRPYSRQYVTHLQDHYAQAHPDEDFAETFAVWLTPGSDWKRRYRGRGALSKLEYVDHLMREIGDTPPPVTAHPREFHWSVSRSRATLGSYFRNKRREFARAYIGYHDPVLCRLFPPLDAAATSESARRFLQRHRRVITAEVARWGRIPKYAADQIIRRLAERAGKMGLRVLRDDANAVLRVGICVAALALASRDQYLRVLDAEPAS